MTALGQEQGEGDGVGGLAVDVTASVGALTLEVAMRVAPGERVAIVGPNGAGKSSVLRVIAGLHRISRGSVALDGRTLEDPVSGVHIPPAVRGFGVAFQDLRLFPHMTVRQNIAFGARDGRADAAITRWLTALDLDDLADRRPESLSGGQQQRVALARALVAARTGVLLDEPMSAQDAHSRAVVRHALHEHLATLGVPVVMVTHEPLEALALAERLVVLVGGVVVQTGTPAEVASQPRSDYVARLVGTNLLRGRRAGDALHIGNSLVVRHSGGPTADGPAFATVHPRQISLHVEEPGGSPRNVWPGIVTHLEISGDRVRAVVDVGIPLVVEITASSLATMGLAEGARVWSAFKAADVEAYPM